MALKLPKLWSNLSDGTVYVYMDVNNPAWTYLTGITTTDSAIGHTVAQMYASTKRYNNVILYFFIFINNYNLLYRYLINW